MIISMFFTINIIGLEHEIVNELSLVNHDAIRWQYQSAKCDKVTQQHHRVKANIARRPGGLLIVGNLLTC